MKHSAAGTIPERAVQEYISGDTQETISERYGVVPSAVSLFLKNRRVNIRGSKPKVQEQSDSAIQPFYSGLCACLGRGYFKLADGHMPCPRCDLRKRQMGG